MGHPMLRNKILLNHVFFFSTEKEDFLYVTFAGHDILFLKDFQINDKEYTMQMEKISCTVYVPGRHEVACRH
jgi:hypothetical protein